jgi:hypothetical protein
VTDNIRVNATCVKIRVMSAPRITFSQRLSADCYVGCWRSFKPLWLSRQDSDKITGVRLVELDRNQSSTSGSVM